MTAVPGLPIAEERVEWAVTERRGSGDVYWDTRTAREDAETDLAWWRRKYPNRVFSGISSRRVIVTQWAEADDE